MDGMNKWQIFLKSGSFRRKLRNYERFVLDSECKPLTSNLQLSIETESAADQQTNADLYKEIDFQAVEIGDYSDSLDVHVDDFYDEQSYYSPDESSQFELDSIDELQDNTENLTTFIRNWSLEHKITDPRRLLGTSRKQLELIKIEGGQYWHTGFGECLRQAFRDLNEPKKISVNINIDGLTLFKNGTDQVWPILFNIFEIPDMKPMIIGIFHGKCKPNFIEEFLKPFADEACLILQSGIFINAKLLTVNIRAFICDSPARAFIKGTVNFNSFHGCMKCTAVGERSQDLHTNVYPLAKASKRTDEGFRSWSYEDHHRVYRSRENGKLKKVSVKSPLLRLPIDFIQDVIVSDSLHLLHLGIMKKLLTIYKTGQIYYTKWTQSETECINDILSRIKLPSEIHRKVRGLRYHCHWKASECASFLNYIGTALLKKFVDSRHYVILLICFMLLPSVLANTINNIYQLLGTFLKPSSRITSISFK
ncbi:uncharacterized protein LOC129732717 isoform X2 [Wyeomyia smithii]|uniref:uncharacterized protein LOC129732717 isoform X2 n=1 Tax=Wyeomyia smithii TaxID=174621 RepID=UPI002467EA64|nr:uncharacterized protein LOC129732717 isoform X2 [Wyeomyia smithii]